VADLKALGTAVAEIKISQLAEDGADGGGLEAKSAGDGGHVDF